MENIQKRKKQLVESLLKEAPSTKELAYTIKKEILPNKTTDNILKFLLGLENDKFSKIEQDIIKMLDLKKEIANYLK
jgi:hypothetical protein